MRVALIIAVSSLLGCAETAMADQTGATERPRWHAGSDQFFTAQLNAFENNSGIAILVRTQTSGACAALNSPDGSDLDWTAVHSNEMLEMCLLDIAKNLEGIDQMKRWFRNQGFFGVESRSTVPGRVLLEAHWNLEQSGSHMPFDPNWVFWMRWLNRGYTYDASVTYRNGIPEEANASHRTK